MRRLRFSLGLAAVAALATLSPAGAGAVAPDSPGATPVARGATAGATTSISREKLCPRLRANLRRAGGRGGVFVVDARSGVPICRTAARKRRKLASNMKLFTTGAALARLGPDARLRTTLRRGGRLRDGVLEGSLYLVGGGDPVLSSPAFAQRFLGGLGTNLYALARDVRAAGIRRVSGRIVADDGIFDRLRGVPDSGWATSPYIGPLSGLSFNLGYADSDASRFAAAPELVAARKLTRYLRRHGVAVAKGPGRGTAPRGAALVGSLDSPRLSPLVNVTNVYSHNFFAEMLLKGLGARFRGEGSTRAGAAVVEGFARARNSGVRALDGSGLTDNNRASPAQVGRFLVSLRRSPVGGRFVGTLPVAGREGTLTSRMRGTAAEGRCRAKTGTIYGVSALSGYCFPGGGRAIAFSILMNGVGNLYEARRQQDRMAALIARYRG